ncbi:hypothetical protein [Streptomyces sp. NPDC059828]|uniref:hypothetical protein n=1 Tax=Streptomyces sp. NPDC059828 TaxID=3346965 RepID=UPI00364B7A1D
MARSTHTAPRTHGLGLAAATAVLLAVLTALLSPPAHGSPHVPDGAVLASGPLQASSGPCADDGHSAVYSAAARSHRDTTSERRSLPTLATLAPCCTADSPPQSTFPPLPALRPPASTHPADCHPMRAPPPPPGA